MLHLLRSLPPLAAVLLFGAALAPIATADQAVLEPPALNDGGKGGEPGLQPRLAREAGNTIYRIWVDDDALPDCGAWTAATGPSHPATALPPSGRKNVLFNGRLANPGTSDTTLRSYDTGIFYRTGPNGSTDAGSTCRQVCSAASASFEPIETNGPSGPVRTGWRTTWLISDGSDDQTIEFTQDINVEGPVDGTETVANTVVRETHRVRNLGVRPFRFGLRKHWDWQIAEDDGPALGDCDTPDEACDRSMDLTADGSRDGFYPQSYTINHDPGTMTCPPGIQPLQSGCDGNPLYLVAGTVAPPSALVPPPDAPELLQFNNWDVVVGTCWWPNLIDAADCGALGNPFGDDTTIAYFYGLTLSSAVRLLPGEQRSFTQYVVAATDACPGIVQPPTLSCDAGGPYEAECTGEFASIPLDGSGTSDSGEAPLFSWTTDCPGGNFDDPSAEDPVLTLLSEGCLTACEVSLTVTDADDPDASIACSSTVTVADSRGPELGCPPEPLLVECEGGGITRDHPLVQAWLDQAGAHDDCSDESVPVTDDLAQSLRLRTCPTIVPVTFEAVDACGNRTNCVQELILDDTLPPEPSCPDDRRFECGEPVDDQQAWLDSASADDGCSSASIAPELISTTSPCPATVTETWRFTAVDICGNTSTCEAEWTVGDNSPPVVVPPPPRVNECGTPVPGSQEDWFALASAEDGCSGTLEVERELVDEERPCPGSLRQVWRFFAIDDCENMGEAFSTWADEDTLPPEIRGVPGDATVPCDAVPPPVMPFADDLCDPMPTLDFLETRRDGDCPGRYTLTRTWTAVDACGNSATAERTLTVEDVAPPILTGVPPDETVTCDAVPAPGNPSAVDDCSSVTLDFAERREDGACAGDYSLTRTWTATDDCGNATSESQTIVVVDLEPPVLSGVPADEAADCGAVPAPAEPTALDSCSGATVSFTETRLDGSCPQEYRLRRSWTATDGCGNASSSTQLIDVSDSTPPTFSGFPADATADCASVPPPAEPTAVDDCGDATVTFSELRVDGPCAGSHQLQRTWTATDDCGNASSSTQLVDVSDTTAPVLSGVPADAEVECDAVPAPATPTAVDDCGTAAVTFTELRIDGSCPEEYQLQRTWTATDDCGNASSETRVLSVVDTQPPVISGVPADETVDCDAVPPPASPSAADACGGVSLVFTETRIDGRCPQEYQLRRTWTATDDCGNAAEETQVVSVVDDTPPELVVPAPLRLECMGPEGVSASDPRVQAWLATATASDNCSSPVLVMHDAPASFPLGCPDPIEVPVTFTARDECGNETSGVSSVTVVDSTPPVIESVDLPGCLWVPNHRYVCFEDLASRVVATDNCSEDLSVRFAGCASDQPDEAPEDGDRGGRELGNGDGNTSDDCVVAPDGSAACLRSERQGTDPEGRNYTLLIEVSDGCGNTAELPWTVHVPHDQSEHDCEKVDNRSMLKKHDPFPWD